MAQFRKLQTVYWQSRPGAPVHSGVIIEVVPAGKSPQTRREGGYDTTVPRNEVSFVVRVQRDRSERFYWPRTRWLALTPEAAKKVPRYKGYFKNGQKYRRPKLNDFDPSSHD